MKSIEIKGSVRTDLGKKATRELRKNNGVPCVVYGVQKDESAIIVHPVDLVSGIVDPDGRMTEKRV